MTPAMVWGGALVLYALHLMSHHGQEREPATWLVGLCGAGLFVLGLP